MEKSAWAIERDDNTTLDLQGGEYASGDGEAPFLCSMVCKVMGGHVHVSRCLAESALECQEEGIEHIQRKEAKVEQDWVSHRLFWARSGSSFTPSCLRVLPDITGFEGTTTR
jgi:hypothetical protein